MDLLRCLGQSVKVVAGEKMENVSQGDEKANTVLNLTHVVLLNWRCSLCISGLKCVLNVPGMEQLFFSLPCGISLAWSEYGWAEVEVCHKELC